jgi:hypothetical protein
MKGVYRCEPENLPCEKEDKIGAHQIFPILTHPVPRFPVYKHDCPRVCFASAMRACSNKVDVEQSVFDKYAFWFRNQFIPLFLSYLDRELLEVDMESWLNSGRYSLRYRDQLRKSYSWESRSSRFITGHRRHTLGYKAFTKHELQFTSVPWAYRNTPLQDAKERQICGPADEKKCMANAFINLLEGVAHRHFKHYCGRKNWMEMCQGIENEMERIPGMILGAADGSGFDMTQLRQHNALMNELIMACARHHNVVWKEPLTVEDLEWALDDSLVMNVEMDNGQLRYKAEGRASGDGWTTFGNTMLMNSYWMYTFHLAGIQDYFLNSKGDDVLFGMKPKDRPAFEVAKAQVFTMFKHEHKHGLAQICKKILWGQIEDLDFLSNHFFWTDEHHLRMTRIPARVIQTNSWSSKLAHIPPNIDFEDARKQLCYAKGMCLLSWGRGLPIWEALGNKMVQLGHKGKLSEFNPYSDGDRVWHARNDRSAYMVYLNKRYGLVEQDVLRIEDKISRITSLKGELFDESLEHLYRGV